MQFYLTHTKNFVNLIKIEFRNSGMGVKVLYHAVHQTVRLGSLTANFLPPHLIPVLSCEILVVSHCPPLLTSC